MTAQPILDIAANGEALARRAADWIVERMTATSGPFAFNLSGGSTPKRLYELLASPPYQTRVPWERVHLFFGDERFVAPDDPESNYRMAHDAMIAHVPIPPDHVHPIPYGPSHQGAATGYEQTLKRFYGAERLDPARPLFDITLLGLGPDGHTASLFPGSPALEERQAWVLPVIGDKPPPQRITLTYPALDSSRAVAFLVAGAEKHAIAERVQRGDRALPAARITAAGELRWFLDRAAAGK